MVQKLQILLGERSETSDALRVARGEASNSDFHATYEDACRLVCNFQFFDKVEDAKLMGFVRKISEGGTAAFEGFRTSEPDKFNDIVESFSKLWRVKESLVRRKLLEFSTYKEMLRTEYV